MPRRLHQTLADYVVIALSPALIMTLVGSLVFFLLAVFYQGQFQTRLHWVMACFVFAAVLISRISIEEGFERAIPFGAVLAVLVGIAANRFMEVHGSWIEGFSWLINGSLIALVWWCAHRLTWDCTVIDDSQDASGEGLLQTAGLERPSGAKDNDEPEAAERRIEGTTSRDAPTGWWARFVERQRRPHAPGVWVVYFSLAALPLFGIGQWFIPAANVAGRRYAFALLCVYVASGLGLLLTTSFLGLRRYLRQRRIEMPTMMANLWLGIGAVIIVLLLLVAALLPRPSAEYTISQLPFRLGSPEQRASKTAAVSREGTQDQQPGGAEGEPTQEDQPGAEPNSDNDQGLASSDNSQGQGTTESQSQSQSKSGQGVQKGSASQKNQSDSSGQSPAAEGQSSSSQSQQGQREAPAPSDHSDQQASHPASSESGEREQQGDRSAQNGKPATEATSEAARPTAESRDRSDDSPADQPANPDQPLESPPLTMPHTGIEAVGGVLATLLKLIFYAAFALAVLAACWRYRAEILQAIRDFLAGLRNWWAGLLGRRKPGREADDAAQIVVPPPPFASYADPFTMGLEARYSAAELVRYSFEAFEAWSREHGCPREADETPHELARDVARAHAALAEPARRLAELYARAAFGRGELPPDARERLRELWRAMRAETTPMPPPRAESV